MPRYSNASIISSIQNGDEEILFYLAKKYFQTGRRWLRRNGFRDSDTPSIFSAILVRIYREIQQSRISTNIDFENFFFNYLGEYSDQHRRQQENQHDKPDEKKEIIGSCYSILDESSRKVLSARYADKLSFEEISSRLNYSNPVIAQFEFNKAFMLIEKISRARLNISEN